jgi:hypothetical protein
MPLPQQEREAVHDYCRRDLGGSMNWYVDQFSFIGEIELRRRLGRAFYSARYIYKLMEALSVSGDELHAFVKFQVAQYASIYEAVISHLLWGHFKGHAEVLGMETHKIYKKVSGLSKDTTMKYGGEDLHTCIYATVRKQRNSISFPDKVDCAVRVGFVQSAYAEEIKQLYALRNLAHIEAEAEKQIEVEIEHSKSAYWRMQPFLKHVVDTVGQTT